MKHVVELSVTRAQDSRPQTFLQLEKANRSLSVPTGLGPVGRALLKELEAVLEALTDQLFGLEGTPT